MVLTLVSALMVELLTSLFTLTLDFTEFKELWKNIVYIYTN